MPADADRIVRQCSWTPAGRLLETADVYAGGSSETILGGILRSLGPADRERVFLATKGRFPVGVEPRDSGTSRRHLRRALDASLKPAGRRPRRPVPGALVGSRSRRWMRRSVSSRTRCTPGLISYAGVSNFTGWQTARAAAMAAGRFPLVSTQPQYNLSRARRSRGDRPRRDRRRHGRAAVVAARRWVADRQVPARHRRRPARRRLGEDPTRGCRGVRPRRNALDENLGGWSMRSRAVAARAAGATSAQIALALARSASGRRLSDRRRANDGAARPEPRCDRSRAHGRGRTSTRSSERPRPRPTGRTASRGSCSAHAPIG